MSQPTMLMVRARMLHSSMLEAACGKEGGNLDRMHDRLCVTRNIGQMDVYEHDDLSCEQLLAHFRMMYQLTAAYAAEAGSADSECDTDTINWHGVKIALRACELFIAEMREESA